MRLRRWAGVLAFTALALLVAEGTLRMALRPAGYYPRRPGLVEVRHTDPARFPGLSPSARYSINSRGLRGPEDDPAAQWRILCLGGSTTECGYLDDARTWPALLQRRLNESGPCRTWVTSSGIGGAGVVDHRVQAEWLLRDLQVDTVVLLPGINDLEREREFEPSLLSSRAALDRVFDAPYLPHEGPESALVTGLRRTRDRVAVAWRRSGAQEDRFARMFERRRAARAGGPKVGEVPPLGRPLAIYEENLRELVAHLRSRGLGVLVLTQPVMWREDLPPELEALLWFGAVPPPAEEPWPFYSVPVLARMMEAYNEATRRVCREAGVPCLDVASLLPRDTRTFYDDCHFNEAGAEAVARLAARALLPLSPCRDGAPASR